MRLRSLGRTLFLALAVVIAAPAAAQAQAIIDNGTVRLGVHPEAHLNVPGPPSAQGTTTVGVRFLPTNNEATGPGCACEGWGAADATSGETGFANESEGGTTNIFPVSFVSDADSAVSVVEIGDPGVLLVTHDYHPSPDTANLYEVTVTIQNISAAPVDARYRRVMDWDIEPTAFSEFVTVQTGDASQLLDNDNDGFATANPLGPDGSITPMFTGDFEDEGPHDHGSRFDFGLGTIAPGDSEEFEIYYGGASTENAAEAALTAVSGEVFSLGQPDTPDGPTLGTPNTFIFAFAGVGGDPIFPPDDGYYEDTCGGREANRIEGDGDDNVLVGTNGRDLILGRAGADNIRGLRAGDCLFGQRNADRIAGQRGSDIIGGGRGADRLKGQRHKDKIRGGGGRDRIKGGNGRDKLRGGRGIDSIRGGLRRDKIKGDRGRDKLHGGRGHDTLRGAEGNDRLRGGRGRDILDCGAGGADVAVADSQDTVDESCEIVL